MRAVVHDRYGPPDVLRIEDVEPPLTREDEVLVKIQATTVNRTDCEWRKGKRISRLFSGIRRPRSRILGSEFAGKVEGVGVAVTEFAVGDEVFGINPWRFGAHAELISVPQSGPVARRPSALSLEDAAAVCDGALLALSSLRPAGEALTWLKPADLRRGQKILVYGASGSIGTAGVQLARYFGATVTAVTNTRNVEVVRALGADEVIDYTREDFTKNGQTFDVIFDAVGKHSFQRCRGSLKPGGAYVATDHLGNLVRAIWPIRGEGKRVLFPIPPRFRKKDVLFIRGLIDEGRYRPVIDSRYPLEQVVEATRYVETEQKTGNVVLTVSPFTSK